jgi:hypothetical protein
MFGTYTIAQGRHVGSVRFTRDVLTQQYLKQCVLYSNRLDIYIQCHKVYLKLIPEKTSGTPSNPKR